MPDSEVRAENLSLALNARKLVDELIGYIDKGERDPRFDDDLKNALESINATRSSQNMLALFSKLSDRSVFSHYEQLRAIEKVLSDLGNPNITATISNLIADTGGATDQKQNAFEALQFFSALEAHALHDYNVQMQVLRR